MGCFALLRFLAVLVVAWEAASPGAAIALEVTRSSVVDRPPDLVWSMLGDFAGMQRWNSQVRTTVMEGDLGIGLVRVLTALNGRVNRELLVDYSAPARRIKYRLLNVTEWQRPYTRYEVTTTVAPTGTGQSLVTWIMDVDPALGATDEIVTTVLNTIHDTIMAELRRAASNAR